MQVFPRAPGPILHLLGHLCHFLDMVFIANEYFSTFPVCLHPVPPMTHGIWWTLPPLYEIRWGKGEFSLGQRLGSRGGHADLPAGEGFFEPSPHPWA